MRYLLVLATLALGCKSTDSKEAYNPYAPVSNRTPEPVAIDGGATYKDPGPAQKVRNAFNSFHL